MEISSDYFNLQQIKLKIFQSQNPENGRFDVVFEIEGKRLYAHKTMLTLVSDTFDSMISERWIKKCEPIKITGCSYENFYQFHIYLYSGQCQLTPSNICAMYDIAEFYGVQLFKNYCQNYLTTMKITAENVFQLMDLAKKFSITELQTRIDEFISNNFTAVIKSEGFLEIDKHLAKELVFAHKYKPEPEDLFQAVYNYFVRKAIEVQTSNPNMNLNDAIKAQISEFLPYILFCGMEEKFLYEFVVPRAFIFSSLNELGKILNERRRFFEGKVKITNKNGQILHGNVIPDKNVLRNIESLKLLTCCYGSEICCYGNSNCKLPSTPTSVKRKVGIKWYLLLSESCNINVRKYNELRGNDYLLAELSTGITGFQTAEGCKIELE